MTLDSTLRKKIYPGTGTKVPYPTEFVFLNAADVYAKHVSSTGVETQLELGVDFAVTGGGGSSGEVEFPLDGSTFPPLPEGEKLVLYRQIALIQELNIRNFNANDLERLEAGFDRIYMVLQNHEETLLRCVQMLISSSLDPNQIIAQILQASTAAAESAENSATSAGESADARDASIAARVVAEAAAASLPALAGNALKFLRANADASGYDFLTSLSLLAAIDAEPADTAILKSDFAETLQVGYSETARAYTGGNIDPYTGNLLTMDTTSITTIGVLTRVGRVSLLMTGGGEVAYNAAFANHVVGEYVPDANKGSVAQIINDGSHHWIIFGNARA